MNRQQPMVHDQVLIWDADALQAQYLAQLYSQAGFVVQVWDRFMPFKKVAARFPALPQALIMTLAPPTETFFGHCQQLHKILPLSALLVLSHYQDQAFCQSALAAGADDYLCLPLQPEELIARTRAHLARSRTIVDAVLKGNVAKSLVFGPIQLWPALSQVRWAEQTIKLTETEFKLLHFLCRHANQKVTRSEAFHWIWQVAEPPGSRKLDNIMLGLRKKLPPAPSQELITCYGEGYRLRIG